MHPRLPNLVIGYHGCDRDTFESVLYRHEPMKKSENDYDWLGHGIYFWENNYERAYDWAKEMAVRKRRDVNNVAVIGAVLDLGACLNLTDGYSIRHVKNAFDGYKMYSLDSGKPVAKNMSIGNSSDLLLRNLDCAVIQWLHKFLNDAGEEPFDSVRGIFLEGKELYPNSGFNDKTHVQLCVVNDDCIKGLFAPEQYVMAMGLGD